MSVTQYNAYIKARIDKVFQELADTNRISITEEEAKVIKEAGDKGSSADAFERLLRFCVSEINIAILGQDQTTEANSNRASATAGLEVVKSIRDADARIVEQTFNQLIEWMVQLNFGENEVCPTYSLWEQEEVDEALARRDEILTKAGVSFTREYFLRTYDLTEKDIAEKSEQSAETDTAFAESEPYAKEITVQKILDAKADALSKDVKSIQYEQLLQPAIDAVLNGESESDIEMKLLEAFPKMDDETLKARLGDALFAADLLGRVSAS